MSDKPSWPIEIDGIYKMDETGGCRVTAINNDNVHFVLRTKHSDGTITEHGPKIWLASTFRYVFFPDENAPSGKLNLFLQKVIGVAESGAWQSQGRYLAYEARELLAERKVSV